MLKRLDQNLFLAILMIPAIALGTALVSQYGFGLEPCALCVWQRWPYAAAFAVALLALVLRNHWMVPLLAAICFGLSAGFGVFHMGVEEGLWEGLATCSGTDTPNSLEALRAQIEGKQPARCDQVPFSFLGLSIAGWNFVYGTVTALLMLGVAARRWRAA
jgi:disulfide bond formation protein DsbB